MSLAPATRLGPYEIQSALGAGGMGEVYKARDTRLDRTVAIKVLPESLAADPQFRERFDREARAIAALNHPHICSLYDIGSQDGTDFLEYLDGETLAKRLEKGPLPLDHALQYAIEMADALDKAHRQGITHRDLKPGNVTLTKAGTKLLDFGLAKVGGPAVAGVGLSMLPTTPPNLTAQGTILGTLQYMAPEQLEGKEADARTDVFAFGAVVYEMVTGKKAFEGKSQASLIGAIMNSEPRPLSTLQPRTPPVLDRIVKKCLAKDPDERWQSAKDLCDELKWIALDTSGGSGIAPVVPSRPRHERFVRIASAVLLVLVITGAALAVAYLRRAPAEEAAVRLPFSPPEKVTLAGLRAGPVTISPDGRRLAFVASDPDRSEQRLWVRPLDSLAAQALSGTEGAADPFWSPDSRFIGFFAQGKLKKVEATGGPPQTLCDAVWPYGGTWSRAGVILFAASAGTQLFRVPAAGGVATPLTLDRPNREVYWPSFLPDGRHFVYYGRPQKMGTYVASLDSNDTTFLLGDSQGGVAYASGHLLRFSRSAGQLESSRTLMAQPFDASRLQLTGEPSPVAEPLSYSSFRAKGAFSVSENGRLVYGSVGNSVTQLIWFDRTGRELGSVGGSVGYRQPFLSRDERTVAVERTDPQVGSTNIWLIEVARGVASRLTFSPGLDLTPVLSPDGSRVVFASPREGNPPRLYQQDSSGAGRPELLLTSQIGAPTDWSRDGRFVVYVTLDPKTQWDLWVLPMGPDPPSAVRTPVPFLQTEFNEHAGQLSPDGRWMAYGSDESGTWEVYVRAFPASGARWQVSTTGGVSPRWQRNGRELFYIAADGTLMTVTVTPGTGFSASAPQALFKTRMLDFRDTFATNYVVAGDGQRFLINTIVQEAPSPTTVVLNWPALLKK